MESYEELVWIYNDPDGNNHLNTILQEEAETERRYKKTFAFLQSLLTFMFVIGLAKTGTILYKKEKTEMKEEKKVYDSHYYENGFRQYYILDTDESSKAESKEATKEEHHVVENTKDVMNSKDVERIAVLGERNSKVSDIASHLVRCFPEVEVTTSLARLGKWFQDEQLEFSKSPTLVVSAFLNIYDWVDLMRQFPLHAPNHENMDWHTFVTTPVSHPIFIFLNI